MSPLLHPLAPGPEETPLINWTVAALKGDPFPQSSASALMGKCTRIIPFTSSLLLPLILFAIELQPVPTELDAVGALACWVLPTSAYHPGPIFTGTMLALYKHSPSIHPRREA